MSLQLHVESYSELRFFLAERTPYKHIIYLVDYLREDINLCSRNGSGLLHLLFSNAHPPLTPRFTQLLIDKDIDLSIRTKRRGASALNCALRYGHDAAAVILLKAGIPFDPSDPMLHFAAKNGWADVVKHFISRKADVSTPRPRDGRLAIECAVRHGVRIHGSTPGYTTVMRNVLTLDVLTSQKEVSVAEAGGGSELEALYDTGYLSTIRMLALQMPTTSFSYLCRYCDSDD
ncbi:hypothetical protein FQN57_005735 [Myotisia sp. PD_48]|nr:hypothetical protein FQN57_005735 [Myotisia sp. PD_48]